MPFKIFGKLDFDGSGLKKGLNKAKAGVKGFGAKAKSYMKGVGGAIAGAFAVGAIIQQVKETVDWGTKVRDLANAWGITTTEVQQFQYAARQSGIEVEDLMDAMKDAAKSAGEVTSAAGNEGKAAMFRTLGIEVDSLRNKNPAEVFKTIAAAIEQMEGQTTPEALVAIEGLMGGGGMKALNMMRGGMGGLIEDFDGLGIAVDDMTINKLGAMGDKVAELEDRWRSMWAGAAGGLFDFFDDFMDTHGAITDAMGDEMLRGFGFLFGVSSEDVAKQRKWEKEQGETHSVVGRIAERQQKRAIKNAEREAKKIAEIKKKAQDKEVDADAAKAAKILAKQKADTKALATSRKASLEKKQAGWTGFQATGLEKIGGQLGMRTTHLNVAQRQLAIMIKAEERNLRAADNVQKIKNEIAP